MTAHSGIPTPEEIAAMLDEIAPRRSYDVALHTQRPDIRVYCTFIGASPLAVCGHVLCAVRQGVA